MLQCELRHYVPSRHLPSAKSSIVGRFVTDFYVYRIVTRCYCNHNCKRVDFKASLRPLGFTQVLNSIDALLPLLQSASIIGSAVEDWAEPLVDLVCNLSHQNVPGVGSIMASSSQASVLSPTELYCAQVPRFLILAMGAHVDHPRWALC